MVSAVFMLQYCGLLNSVEDLRRELNQLDTFGLAPRLYVHSKGDRLVSVDDVASHANEIAAQLPVTREVWEVDEHCALPVEDCARYWNAVRRLVKSSQCAGEAKL